MNDKEEQFVGLTDNPFHEQTEAFITYKHLFLLPWAVVVLVVNKIDCT